MGASLDEAKAKNILRQVEFYFSDSNLPRDKFLKQTMQRSDDECILPPKSYFPLFYVLFLLLFDMTGISVVSLALICSFSRMKSHPGLNAAAKPEDVPEETVLTVAEVLRRSSSLRVSEDGKRMGRSTVLLKPEEVIEQVDSRSIATSPLPCDVKLEDVESFFAQQLLLRDIKLVISRYKLNHERYIWSSGGIAIDGLAVCKAFFGALDHLQGKMLQYAVCRSVASSGGIAIDGLAVSKLGRGF